MHTNWHRLKIEEVFARTDSSESGLSVSEARHRFRKICPNEIKEGKKKSYNVTMKVKVPAGHKHGTIVTIKRKYLKPLRSKVAKIH